MMKFYRKFQIIIEYIRGLDEIPDWMQRIFATAIDIHWTNHLI